MFLEESNWRGVRLDRAGLSLRLCRFFRFRFAFLLQLVVPPACLPTNQASCCAAQPFGSIEDGRRGRSNSCNNQGDRQDPSSRVGDARWRDRRACYPSRLELGFVVSPFPTTSLLARLQLSQGGVGRSVGRSIKEVSF